MASLAVKLSKTIDALIKEPTPAKMFLLNTFLPKAVPFNARHGFKIKKIDPSEALIFLPFKKANLNHIASVHACAIATAGEMAAGLLIMRNFSLGKFRIIMKELHSEYLYQGKLDLLSLASMTDGEREALSHALAEKGEGDVVIKSHIRNVEGKSVAVVTTTWQLKSWEKTKAPLS